MSKMCQIPCENFGKSKELFDIEVCEECDGTGEVVNVSKDSDIKFCPYCHGFGEVLKKE